VLALLTMESPSSSAGPATEPAKVALLQAIRPLEAADVVRGQYHGYRGEPGVAPDSRVETYVAVRLGVDNARWKDVPMLVRAGKCMAATVTEVRVVLKPPARPFFDSASAPANELRFRLSPDVSMTLMARIKLPGEEMVGEDAALVEHRQTSDEMPPYERLLGDALRGDRTLFGSEAGVEAAWRVVNDVLRTEQPPHTYEPGSWGPSEAEGLMSSWRSRLSDPR
jgi:glucose-6-phosphate 1-dehydrogenase